MIELKKLYLDGWLSYDKAEICLNNPGVTLIKGNIGSGKSAILEAIFYLLFGKTLRGKDSVNSLANKVLNAGYEISLDFSVNDTAYKIKEIRNRDKKGFYTYKNGELVTLDGATDPRKYVVNAVGMSYQEFESIAFLGQKQSQVLVEGTPGDRAKAIVSIFGLNKYDTTVKKCAELIKLSAEKIEKQNEKIEQIGSEIKSLEQMLDNAIEYDKKLVDKYTSKLEKANEMIANVKEKLERLQTIAQESKRHLGIAEAVESQRIKAKLLKKEIADLKKQVKDTDWPEEDSEKIKDDFDDLNHEKAKWSVAATQQHAEISRIKKCGDVCPINQKKCPIDVPITYKVELTAECTRKKDEAVAEISRIKKKLAAMNECLCQVLEKEKIESSIENKLKILDSLSNDIETPDADEAQNMLQKCKDAIVTGNEKLKILVDQHADLRIELSKQEQAKHFKKTINKALEEKNEQLSTQKNKLKEEEEENKYLAACSIILKKTKLYKIDLVINMLNDYINEILDTISNNEYKAQFVSQQNDAKGERILDKLGIIVSDSHKSIPIELCSGGQRDEVGLSVLLATWKAAYKLSNKSVSSLWLDEAFGALDQETIDRVFESVIQVASDLGAKTVKIISHRDLDARLFDQIWAVQIKDGISSLTIT